MKKSWLALIVPGVAATFVAVLLLCLLLLKLLWSWTIPDLFPGAVAQNLVSGWISWFTSLKLAIFVAFLATVFRLRGSAEAKVEVEHCRTGPGEDEPQA